jgi:hypothetical protein
MSTRRGPVFDEGCAFGHVVQLRCDTNTAFTTVAFRSRSSRDLRSLTETGYILSDVRRRSSTVRCIEGLQLSVVSANHLLDTEAGSTRRVQKSPICVFSQQLPKPRITPSKSML